MSSGAGSSQVCTAAALWSSVHPGFGIFTGAAGFSAGRLLTRAVSGNWKVSPGSPLPVTVFCHLVASGPAWPAERSH